MQKERFAVIFVLFAAVQVSISAQALEPDVSGSKDHRLVTRMPDFYISTYEDKTFAGREFSTADGSVTVEGHLLYFDYRLQEGAKEPGVTQIVRNYTQALRKIGGTVLAQGEDRATLRVKKDGREVWMDVFVYSGSNYVVTIVEKEIMQQDVVADADALKKGLVQDGHMAVYGIYFDHNASTLKPESAPALEHVYRLLKENPDLALFVVGHTDSTGALDYNMNLSRSRAAAVVKELVSGRGIARARLEPAGVGPLCPVASNITEAGRAKNRRVELVRR